ncbi:MAG TPA: sigma-70 family RNA polymerase sigma factor [Chthoniobacterales bacterium]|nr:sigma-70 family RNA polymerase sigma factor [Chthoniobacterales bacterium]
MTIQTPEALFINMSGNEPSPPGRAQEDAEDVRLMQLVSRGDPAAFEKLVERHQRLVVGTVARMLGNNADAEDIAQQVFVRVWKSASRYVARAKFTTWLLKITRNLVFNELRRRSRHAQVPLHPDPEEEERPLRDEGAVAPDASLLEAELQQAIDAAIARLPETQRMAVILRRYEELSYEEIAEALDQSVSGVKSLLFRARTELRASLSRYLSG